ncbi:MAG: glycosyltransferase family 39 protein [Acidobacteria bacterium]|nr:glycosyltransferase family 39 protein [Acidobacteriota bacterium]
MTAGRRSAVAADLPGSGRARPRNVVFAVLLLVWAAFLAAHAGPFASGSDQSGYLNIARLLAEGRVAEQVREIQGVPMRRFDPWCFTPLGFRPGPDPDVLLPAYPFGLALHQLAASRLVGLRHAAALVDVGAGTLMLWLLYRLGRSFGLTRPWAAAATVIFAASPLTIHFYTWAMSDGVATTWCTAAVLFARKSSKDARYAALSGLALGIAVLVRPTDVLVIPAIVVAMRWTRGSALWLVVGAAPAVIGLAVYDVILFGSPFYTGYGDMGRFFAWSHFWPRVIHFGRWLGRFWTPLAPLLFLAVVPRALRGDRRALTLLVWFGAFVVFYAFYRFSNEAWWYLRFIMPGLPAFLLGAVCEARQAALWVAARRPATPRLRQAGAVGLVLAGLLAVGSSLRWVRHYSVLELGRGEKAYPKGIAWMERHVEPDAVIVSMQMSGALFFYSRHPIVRFDIVTPRDLERLLATTRHAGTPVYALVFEFEVDTLLERFPGVFEDFGQSGRSRLFRLAPGARPPSRREPG